ncbi:MULTISPECIES: XVIPCD domain-containing protein [unclassified Lysobacter]|uniref:XVIPCD domain-containing protein n=1 Tax=unclassified Lysobacter TaxID=2635362 RepID=UPI001BEC1FDE|nr:MULTISPECIES: XVIPCD domain-containing protein [unclassified Lysobacter]MBT2748015.1 phospholipase [Lysobacter sp. ISL-42]MBT2752773.1 phospholipase [Lysobacter sp. ISL-50]MBT2779361.1 phospholipase [Lysobacter sp. ISL-54]MBT2781917.1 phospholipase [Lysobacter sp. ISL-52]
MFPTADELKARQDLLRQMRGSGDPTAIARANELQRTYHDDNMAVLAKDTYWSAMGEHAPDEGKKSPPGWIRASENLDKLREAAPKLAALSDEQLRDYLKPVNSGFRAEIYLPIQEVLGPGYKPVIVPKGSAGEVVGADGELHATGAEDFVANNFPQSIGLKTDYYDRTMQLALFMENNGLIAEYAGHSLGGGMSSAMSAITGRPATTFNAAGLHPQTALRFAAEKPGVQVHDTDRTVTSYQIHGELLNEGIQHNIDRLDALHRKQLAGVLGETCGLLHKAPEGQQLLSAKLNVMMPEHARPAVREFVKQLAEGDTRQMLRDLPLAAGKVVPLDDVKTWDGAGRLIDREQRLTLTEISNFAKPVLETAYLTLQGAHMGHSVGQVAAASGRITAQGMDDAGDVVRGATVKAADFADVVSGVSHATAQAGVRVGGETTAQARLAAGRAEAAIDTVQGEVQLRGAQAGAGVLRGISSLDVLPDGVQRWAHDKADDIERGGVEAHARNRGEAAQARAGATADAASIRAATSARVVELERVQAVVEDTQRTVIAGSGIASDRALDAGGRTLDAVSARMPAVGAGAGAAAGAAAGLAGNANVFDLTQTTRFARGVTTQAGESIERHLMTEAVLPSMAARVQAQERAAHAQFPRLTAPAPEQAPAAARPAQTGPDSPEHRDHSTLLQIRDGMRKLDAQIGKPYDEGSERISRALLAESKSPVGRYPGTDVSVAANVLKQVDHVVPGGAGNIFAVEGKLDDPAHKRVFVSSEQALNTPVEQSDQKLAAANRAIDQELERQRTQQQTQTQGPDEPGKKR